MGGAWRLRVQYSSTQQAGTLSGEPDEEFQGHRLEEGREYLLRVLTGLAGAQLALVEELAPGLGLKRCVARLPLSSGWMWTM